MKTTPIRYSICPVNPAGHHYEVSCTIDTPDPAGQLFALPAWIPGSYLIRDFARNIISIRAESLGQAIQLHKIDKHTWQAPAQNKSAPLTVTCLVYAWDLSVRSAHLDQTHGFFNGSSVFLRVIGHEEAPCLIDIQPPCGKEFKDWKVASALRPARGEKNGAKLNGFGLYRADNYDELIDHPVEMGRISFARFEACGVPHEIAITGRHDCDLERLSRDLKRVCEWQIRFFGEPAPMARYVFLLTVVGEGYGGLEHRASTALLCSRHDLPYQGMTGMSEGYRTLLGLCSHEYFHTWNVKRIKPAAFTPYNLNSENYTTLLWAFEGFTSYYDDLALLRSGVITLKDWLELSAKTMSNVQKTPGRLVQSLSESSFDAWSKFYKPDENTTNAVISYYAKGALLALALDITLRSTKKTSLDEVMRTLWKDHGQTGLGVDTDDIRKISEQLSGLNLKRFFDDFVHGTRELPLKKLLASAGIKLEWNAAKGPSLGVKTSAEGNEVKLATVYTGGAAQAAGLSAGDTLVAIDGLRVSATSLDKILARRKAGETLELHAFRRDELMRFKVCLAAAPADSATLTTTQGNSALRKAWLGA